MDAIHDNRRLEHAFDFGLQQNKSRRTRNDLLRILRHPCFRRSDRTILILAVMPSFIELFAGCGGLSLGLRAAGFNELMANELSSMPAETFALNLMGVDMRSDDFAATRPSNRPVLWLDPVSDDMDKRLADNPFERPETDMSEVADAGDLTGRLVVGDIRRLNDLADRLGHPLIKGDVDLVSGGPPCQSFSLAGRREFGNQRNQLPFEFARFVERQRPRMVLLENVEGILRPFKLEDRTYYAWFEVCKAFASIGYATRPLLINARNCGVAQNRPRFVMLAVRMDLAMFLSAPTATLFAQGMRLINAVGHGDVDYNQDAWKVLDLTGADAADKTAGTVLEPLTAFCDPGRQRTVSDAIRDLEEERDHRRSDYVRDLNDILTPALADPKRRMANLSHPNSTPRVRARFRVYQTMAGMDKAAVADVKAVIRGDALHVSAATAKALLSADLLPYDEFNPPIDEAELDAYLSGLHTRKFSQKALRANEPAPAALSIPDDICHYREARTLSVREMARIQSFPDSFEFRGIPTTGGARRRYQVPQYTQIGNAVPPLMARRLGMVVNAILKELE